MTGISQNDGSCKSFSSSGFKHGYLGYPFSKFEGASLWRFLNLDFFLTKGPGWSLVMVLKLSILFFFYIGCTREIRLYQQKCMFTLFNLVVLQMIMESIHPNQKPHISVLFFSHILVWTTWCLPMSFWKTWRKWDMVLVEFSVHSLRCSPSPLRVTTICSIRGSLETFTYHCSFGPGNSHPDPYNPHRSGCVMKQKAGHIPDLFSVAVRSHNLHSTSPGFCRPHTFTLWDFNRTKKIPLSNPFQPRDFVQFSTGQCW